MNYRPGEGYDKGYTCRMNGGARNGMLNEHGKQQFLQD
jgi:hypothetical protein